MFRSVAGIKVFRLRPISWVGPLVVAVGNAVFVTLPPLDKRLPTLAIFAIPSLLLLWMSLRPRAIVKPDGLKLYSLSGSRWIPWASVKGVGMPGDKIELEIDDGKIVVEAPFADGDLDRPYTIRAMNEIERSWRSWRASNGVGLRQDSSIAPPEE